MERGFSCNTHLKVNLDLKNNCWFRVIWQKPIFDGSQDVCFLAFFAVLTV